jgi:hypothetical protein
MPDVLLVPPAIAGGYVYTKHFFPQASGLKLKLILGKGIIRNKKQQRILLMILLR